MPRSLKIILFSLLALLAGCSIQMARDRSGPPPSEVVEGYSADIQVTWGGRILGTENLEDGTRLEIVSLPLDTAGKPLTDQPKQGRFIAYTPRFLEPIDFAPDRFVSIDGWVRGVEEGALEDVPVGQLPPRYPMVEITKIRLWPKYMPSDGPVINIGVGIGVGF